jgi:hypothetical protein
MAADPTTTLPNLTTLILAVGALGTAAFGLVDALKALPGGGVSRFGFKFVKQVIEKLLPAPGEAKANALNRDDLIFALQSQWINGAASLADQVNIAKSLIKLRLTPDTAAKMADATGVDKDLLTQVAQSIKSATALTQPQSDTYGRFDLMLTTLLDQAYQRAEQRYRNAAKLYAVPIAVALAVVANHWVVPAANQLHPLGAVLLGLIATPIAPVAKDVASAIQTASKAIQAFKG